jgi:hypothetical protein
VKSSITGAEEFLKKWGIAFEDILRHVQPVDQAETVLLVGSIVDGLGTSSSDINLLIIGDRGLDATLVFGESGFEQSVARLPQGRRVTTEYWRAEDVERLQRRLSTVGVAIYEPSRLHQIEYFSDLELRLLHRLRTGLVLTNPLRAEQWRQAMEVETLPNYLLLHWAGAYQAMRDDAWAQAEDGDGLSAWWMARAALDYLGAAMLASVGETNPYSKWRPRLLQRNRPELGTYVVDRLFTLLSADPGIDQRSHLVEITDFSDEALTQSLARQPRTEPAMRALEAKLLLSRSSAEDGALDTADTSRRRGFQAR